MKIVKNLDALLLAGLAGAVAILAACASSPAVTADQVDGGELWGQTCQHCHNFRSPTELSDSEWEVVLAHMRVRTNLTGEQERAILAFLQDSN